MRCKRTSPLCHFLADWPHRFFLLNSKRVLQFDVSLCSLLSSIAQHLVLKLNLCYFVLNAHIKPTSWMIIDNKMTWSVFCNFIDQLLCMLDLVWDAKWLFAKFHPLQYYSTFYQIIKDSSCSKALHTLC